nr:MAG TPA: hypothetical protein [Caudoviricetes sp.]
MTAPCKNCQDREVGCHSKCDRYAEYNRQREDIRQKRLHDAQTDPSIFLAGNATKIKWENHKHRRR